MTDGTDGTDGTGDATGGGAGDGTGYALRISDLEVARYQMMAARAVADEAEDWVRQGVVPGARVLDLGCGPGAVLVELTRLVGPTGMVVGVDQDADALAVARDLADRASRAAPGELGAVELVNGDAADTGLAADFDVVMMRHVLAHNGPRTDAIVAHAAGLLRDGGHLYVVDSDGSAIRMDPADEDLEDLQRRYLEFHARRGNPLVVGPRLGSILRGAGLEVVHRVARMQVISPIPPGGPAWAAADAMVASGIATADDVERWGRAMARAGQPGSAMFVPFYAAAGRCGA